MDHLDLRTMLFMLRFCKTDSTPKRSGPDLNQTHTRAPKKGVGKDCSLEVSRGIHEPPLVQGALVCIGSDTFDGRRELSEQAYRSPQHSFTDFFSNLVSWAEVLSDRPVGLTLRPWTATEPVSLAKSCDPCRFCVFDSSETLFVPNCRSGIGFARPCGGLCHPDTALPATWSRTFSLGRSVASR